MRPDTITDPTADQAAPDLVEGQEYGTAEQPFWRPGPNPTVDLVVTRDKDGRRQVLLIRRADRDGVAERGKWALPGGFHDTDAATGDPWVPGNETAQQAAVRELHEETALDARTLAGRLRHVGFYDDRGRDPRNNPAAWAVSNVFAVHLTSELADTPVEGLDDADDAAWFDEDRLPDGGRLAFDHTDILADALS